METYEALIIFPSQAAAEPLSEGKNAFEETLKKYEGKVINRSELGRRTLGYPIKKSREGYFASFDLELNPSKVEPLSHTLRLSEGIIKFTIIRKPKIRIKRIPKVSSKPPVHKQTSAPRTSGGSAAHFGGEKTRSH